MSKDLETTPIDDDEDRSQGELEGDEEFVELITEDLNQELIETISNRMMILMMIDQFVRSLQSSNRTLKVE